MSKKPGTFVAAVTATLTLYVLGCSVVLAQPQVEIEYISSFGSFGRTQAGTFYAPVGIVIDTQGRLLIPDNENHRVQRCSTQGSCEVFGSYGTQLGQFYWPAGVVEDSLGRIIVSEAGNDRVQIRNTQGVWSLLGTDFDLPAGMVVDDQDRIIIADENKNRVQVCTVGGSCTAFGSYGSGLGQFKRPRAVALDSRGRILVSDWDNHRIQICDYAGNCTAFGSLGVVAGKFHYPSELAVDGQDRIIVTDRDNHRLQICEMSGACTAYGQRGTGPGQFNSPVGVAVDSQNRIYVADRDNNRIQILQATYADDPPPPYPFVINAGLNDAWYYPLTDGQGFFITVFPDLGKVSLAWFTYDTELPPVDSVANLGDPGHRWLTALGSIDGNQAIMNITLTSAGLFDTATEIERTDPPGSDGTITLTFEDCNSAMVEYDIPAISRQGTIPIVRVVNDNIVLCEALLNE